MKQLIKILGKFLNPISLALLLTGCGTIIDPAPYRPTRDPAVLKTGPYTSGNIFVFFGLQDASRKLMALSDGYTSVADNFSRQQLFLDVPIFGLAVATVANGTFAGSKDATIALGYSSATLAGTKTYFAPQTKVGAYSNASYSLSCGSVVALEMDQIQTAKNGAVNNTTANLETYLDAAYKTLTAGSFGGGAALTADEKSGLMTARDSALTAYQGLSAAKDVLDQAPVQLAAYAQSIIKSTSKSVVTGTQNLDAVLTAFKAATTQPASTPTPAAPKAPAALPGAPPPPPDATSAADLVAKLQVNSADAAALTKAINAGWSSLTSCALPS